MFCASTLFPLMKAPKPTDSTAAVVRQPATDRARQSESNVLGTGWQAQGSTAWRADRLGPTAPCSSAAGWSVASSARSARACTEAAHPPSSACSTRRTARRAHLELPAGRLPGKVVLRAAPSGRRPGPKASYLEVSLRACSIGAPSWHNGRRRREGLLRRGLGGREHRHQPQVRRHEHMCTRRHAHKQNAHVSRMPHVWRCELQTHIDTRAGRAT